MRTKMRALSLMLAALLSVPPISGLGATAAPTARPNIVILVADDWGFTDVGAFGGEISTPNLDTLARQGVRFSNFHTAGSCSPTRGMLLTGVDSHRIGLGNLEVTTPLEHIGKPGYSGVLDDNVVTLATLLQDAGYHTSMSGKWNLGRTPDKLPGKRGFARSLAQPDTGSDNWEAKPYLGIYDRVQWFEDDQPIALPPDFYSSQFIVDKAIEYIEAGRGAGKPFFSYVAFQANHIPLQAPQEFMNKYRGAYRDGWDALRRARLERAIALGIVPASTTLAMMATTTRWDALSEEDKQYQARRMEVYAGMAEAMDHHVGRLLQYLKRSGEYERTVFIFLSDNGAEASDPYATWLSRRWLAANYSSELDRLGGKGAYAVLGPSWGSAAASPLSTFKFYAGEGGIRVPLIIAGVPQAAQNRITNVFTHVKDVVPTVLEIAGVEPHDGNYRGRAVERITGFSMLNHLRGEAAFIHPAYEAIGYELSGNAAVFKGPYKLVRNLPPVGDGHWRLFDIEKDPGETHDLQGQLPELFRTLLMDYADYARANGVLPMPEDYEYTRQITAYYWVHRGIPKLRAMAPAVLLALALLIPLGIWLRRRRRAISETRT